MAKIQRLGKNLAFPDQEEIVMVGSDGWAVPVPAAMFDRLNAHGYDWDTFVAECRRDAEWRAENCC